MSDRLPNPKQTSKETSKPHPEGQEKHLAKGDNKQEAREKLSYESQRQEKKSTEKSTKPEADSSSNRLKAAAKELHDAVHQKAWGGLGGPEPNVDKILNILEPLSPANRQQLEKTYNQTYGKMGDNLRKDLNSAFDKNHSSDLIHIKKVLDRTPGAADVAGQIDWANACIKEGKNDKQAMEKVIIDAVSMCNANEIQNLGLDAKLKGNPNISTETKQALHLLSQGKDKLYDGDGKMKDNIVKTLSDIALNSHPARLDLYKLALQSASDKYRGKTRETDIKQIDKVFSGDDAKIAKDYLNKGQESTVTKVAGDHKEILGLQWWNNKDNITHAMESASTEEKTLYKQGEALANKYHLGEWLAQHGGQARSKGEKEALKTFQSLQKDGKASTNDREAFKCYNDLKGELDKAGNPREVKLWEAKLLGTEDIVCDLAKCHTDNLIPGLPGSHKAEDLYKTVENLSEKDWQQFRQHPEDLARVAQTLGTFASQEELNKAMSMLRQKINIKDKSWTYDKAKQVGIRGVGEVSEQNKVTPFEEFFGHNTDKSLAKIDKLMNLSESERRAYRDTNNPLHKQIDKQATELVASLKPGLEQDLAKRLLDKVKNNKPVDAIDKVILGELKGNDLKSTISNIEQAYKQNPGTKDQKSLLEKLKNPQTAEDKKIKAYFEMALDKAVDRAGLGEHTRGKENYVPSQYPKFAKPLFEKGYVPIDKKLELATNKQERLQLLVNANKSEQVNLLAASPDAQTKSIQDKVLGQGEERKFLENVLQNSVEGKPMSAADQCRAFVLGYGEKDASDLASKIKQLPDADKQSLANEYFAKYGKQVADDVIQHVSESEKRSMRQVFAEFPVPSKQAILDADANRAERREDRWDATKASADESVEKLLKFVREHKEDIDKMPAGKREEFLKAVDDYQKAEKAYVESGGQQAEALVNATVTALSLGAMLIPGGQTITAARLAAFAAVGGTFRTAAMKCMQGKDFDGSAHNILEQVFHGSTEAVLCFAGPEMLGMKVGGNAVKVALKTGLEEAGVAGAKFTSGLESALTRQLDNASCNDALSGSKALRDKVEQAFRDNALKGTSEKEIQEATNTYIKQLQKETAVKVLAKEATEAGVNVGTGYVSSAGAQLATDIAFPPKEGLTPQQVIERCAAAGQQGAVGGAIFHFGFKGLGAAYHGSKGTIEKVIDAAGKDKYFASNGTVIRHSDGSRTIADGKERVLLKDGDTIVPPSKSPEAARPSKDAQDISHYMSDTGELRRTIPDGYTDLGPNQRMKADGSISASRGATAYDAANDALFKQLKAEAHAHMDKFKHLPKDQQMEELIKWEKKRLGPYSEAQERAYTSFMSESGGKRVPIGELLDRNLLGCAERAHLLKILADENIGTGYAKLVRGDGTGAKKSNHLWLTGNENTIWDPTREKHRIAAEQTKDAYTPEAKLPDYGHNIKSESIRPGEPIEGSPGWRFSKDQPKNSKFVSVVHDAVKHISTHNKEFIDQFAKANPQLRLHELKEGMPVHLPGPDGKMVDGYYIRHIDHNSGDIEFVKPDGIKLTVSKERAFHHLPPLDLTFTEKQLRAGMQKELKEFEKFNIITPRQLGKLESDLKNAKTQKDLDSANSLIEQYRVKLQSVHNAHSESMRQQEAAEAQRKEQIAAKKQAKKEAEQERKKTAVENPEPPPTVETTSEQEADQMLDMIRSKSIHELDENAQLLKEFSKEGVYACTEDEINTAIKDNILQQLSSIKTLISNPKNAEDLAIVLKNHNLANDEDILAQIRQATLDDLQTISRKDLPRTKGALKRAINTMEEAGALSKEDTRELLESIESYKPRTLSETDQQNLADEIKSCEQQLKKLEARQKQPDVQLAGMKESEFDSLLTDLGLHKVRGKQGKHFKIYDAENRMVSHGCVSHKSGSPDQVKSYVWKSNLFPDLKHRLNIQLARLKAA